MMQYSKLKGRIKEVFQTQSAFANAIGLSTVTVNQKLSGKIEWKSSEISKACDVLHIPLTEAWQYFFTLKI